MNKINNNNKYWIKKYILPGKQWSALFTVYVGVDIFAPHFRNSWRTWGNWRVENRRFGVVNTSTWASWRTHTPFTCRYPKIGRFSELFHDFPGGLPRISEERRNSSLANGGTKYLKFNALNLIFKENRKGLFGFLQVFYPHNN